MTSLDTERAIEERHNRPWEPDADAGGDAHPDGVAVLHLVKKMMFQARTFAEAESDASVLERAAGIACEVLGYPTCAIALRQDDGSYRYQAHYVRGSGWQDFPAPSVLHQMAYQELCHAAAWVEGAMWLPSGPPLSALSATGSTVPVFDPGDAAAESGFLWAPSIGEDGSHLGFISPSQVGRWPGAPRPLDALLLGVLAELAAAGIELRRARASLRSTEAPGLPAAGLELGDRRRQLDEVVRSGLELSGEWVLNGGAAQAATDPVTGLVTRPSFLERAGAMVRSAVRGGTACSALCIDIDNFEDVNDSFGQAVGDEVIVGVGRAIAGRLRRADLLARYGGDGFAALLPGTDLPQAVAVAEEIRQLVAGTPPVTVNPPLTVHVSVGAAALRPGEDAGSLLAAAATALGRAKRGGGHRVCAASP